VEVEVVQVLMHMRVNQVDLVVEEMVVQELLILKEQETE